MLKQVAIIGVGLIGGSVAAALRKRFAAVKVLGIGRAEDRLAQARDMGLLHTASTQITDTAESDLIVVCTPVDRIVRDVRAAAAAAPQAVLTDVGSVKAEICRELADLPRFVGSHPMAGSEKTGFAHAEADLFESAECLMSPTEHSDSVAVDLVRSFWESLGSRVTEMTADRHDAIVAAVSHLPHVVAAALARVPTAEEIQFAASGFRDTTRIAAGSTELWASILLANRSSVLSSMQRLEAELTALQQAVAAGDRDELSRLLTISRR